MRSLPLDVRKYAIAVLPLLSTTHAQSVAEGTFYKGGGAPGAAPYQLVDDYQPSIFFSKFNFYSVRRSFTQTPLVMLTVR